ncbi:tRNA 2-selenouridine(34) synthase MnmH [Usitatibacter palustris]|uniref:tRNA 2-selenouridine synthase n=1 Tax=Usitatibacter palustris TaxID=2732487 RepID=A0A6M4H787_9PROT|nr:tRNA 2-selenouridine(34) synthase MnmH [Usitatibacter palustris]QJR15499.1 tRNA 2-selenouridine synthase [Usitatibacter palustris]
MSEFPFVRERPAGSVATPLTLADLAGYDAILDARSPGEFAEDHLPGAVNCPVLDDEERAIVGTAFKQQGAFEARRIGAPIVARNIARHLETTLANHPDRWRPLVYCWRGGGRSLALAYMLRQVGWDAMKLDGGYKAFRKQVSGELETLPSGFRYHVVCGATGSGKSRLLEALAETGAQVLDLEMLAAHRGSVLGDLPDAPQPSQKAFETAIWKALSTYDPARPVFVEAESKKVGNLRVPEALMERMREGKCYRLEIDVAQRIELLLDDYAHFVARPESLLERIECLRSLHGAEAIDRWSESVRVGAWRPLVSDLLENHYDPAYRRSMFRNYKDAQNAVIVTVPDASREGFLQLARQWPC